MQTVVGSMTLATLLAIVLAVYTSRAIARPIRYLTDITRHITDSADFQQRVRVESHDETAMLAESVDRLVRWAGQYTHELNEARETLEDRVEQRTEALKQAQAQVVQSEKMSSLGQLVAGVAHEINNPVSFIYGNITHAREYTRDLLELIELYGQHYPEPDDEIAEHIEDIDLEFITDDLSALLESMQIGADRIKEIVLSLRTFSRLDESAIKSADVHAGIDSTLTILGHRLKAQGSRPKIEVLCHYGDLPLVDCYPGLLNQVFMNLLANAIDALETHMEEDPNFETPQILIATRLVHGQCEVQISNSGPGIPEHVKARMFDPFFTTKEVGRGTGMGLSISYQIVAETHGGSLRCRSSKNRTCFEVRVPLSAHMARCSIVDHPIAS